jgi:hypothetical protein
VSLTEGHLRALGAAAGEHLRAVRRMLVPDRDAVVRVNEPSVTVQPAYEWLLAAPGED